ncbi:MAG: DUF393 domain-containing protein [Rhodospirillales bacterium]|nr:DUF393 domain-containing protein [Rhodospirillales bacterium]MBO6786064.1 DUF393 domain-containing protein [Rhodospirillales bacterium]
MPAALGFDFRNMDGGPFVKDAVMHNRIYDGDCPLCRAEIRHYRSLDDDGRLNLVDVSKNTASLPEDIPAEMLLARFHVERADGVRLSGAQAFAHVWCELPGWQVIGRIASLPGMVHLLEICYRAFLPVRRPLARIVGRFVETAAR